jgi:hypothetical protein
VRTAFIEACTRATWGRFMVGVNDAEEWCRYSARWPEARPLLAETGWERRHFWLFDLHTGQGACFRHAPDGLVVHDLKVKGLDQRCEWKGMRVTMLFGHVLLWLYQQPLDKVLALDLPATIDFREPLGRPVGPGKPWGEHAKEVEDAERDPDPAGPDGV